MPTGRHKKNSLVSGPEASAGSAWAEQCSRTHHGRPPGDPGHRDEPGGDGVGWRHERVTEREGERERDRETEAERDASER